MRKVGGDAGEDGVEDVVEDGGEGIGGRMPYRRGGADHIDCHLSF